MSTMKKSNQGERCATAVRRSAARPEKAWAVIWKNDGAVGARPKEILVVEVWEDCDLLRDKRGIGIVSLAIFRRKQDAETFRENNLDWETVRVEVG